MKRSRMKIRFTFCLALILVLGNMMLVSANAQPLDELITRVDALESQLASSMDVITQLQEQVAALEANPVLELSPFVGIRQGVMNDLAGPHVIFEGANFHFRNKLEV